MDITERQTFGEQIRTYRRRAGLTQEELAERAELSPRGLLYLERDERRPQPATARRLADALELEGAERRLFLDAAPARPAAGTDQAEAEHDGPSISIDRQAAGTTALAALPVPATTPPRIFPTPGHLPMRSAPLAVLAVLAVLVAAVLGTRSLSARLGGAASVMSTPAGPVVLGTDGTRITGPFPSKNMWGVDVLPNGRVVVGVYSGLTGTPSHYGVAEFSPSGDLLWSRTSTPSSASPSTQVSGIASDAANNMYVADYGNRWVEKLSSDGRLLARWGRGLGLQGPSSLAVDRTGNVWILDVNLIRLIKLSPSGKLLGSYGSIGSSVGQFAELGGIAIGRNGDIDVSDWAADRITEFSPAGKAVRAWGSTGNGPGQLNTSQALATDRTGNVYVADTDNHRIEKFTAEGRFLKAWGQLGVRPGEFYYPDGISVAPNGDVYVADNPLVCPCVTRGSVGDRIEVFSPSGKFLFQWTDSVLQHTILSNVSGLAVDSQGDVYATDASHRVVAFGPNHLPLAGWGGEGVASGLLRSPGGVAVDRTGDILVSDTRSGRLQRFTSHGKLVETSSSIGRSGHAGSGLAADSAGHVFLADTNSQRVEELDAAGKPVRAWDVTFWDGGLPPHGAIAVDAAGHIYIGNEASMAVDTYTSTGRYTGSIGGTGPDVGSLRSIAALAVDARGRVYVVDSAQKAILVLSPSGTVLARWTAAHFPALGRPRAIALDRLGNIYVGGGRQIVEIAALR